MPSAQRGDPSHGERLDQVVVCTRIQTCHAILYLGAGGEHQYRNRHMSGADGLTDGWAIPIGKHPVQDDHVIHAAQGNLNTKVAGMRHVNAELFGGKDFLHQIGQPLVTFNDHKVCLFSAAEKF